jgi:hypothetical protein
MMLSGAGGRYQRALCGCDMLKECRNAFVIAAIALIIANTTALASDKTNQIQFAYRVPKDSDLVKVYKDMKERRVLERLQEFLSPFRLPRPVKFTFQSCDGEDDAFYFDNHVTLCYELVDELQWAKPKNTTRDGVEPHDAVAGPFFSIALHEFAHALFDLRDVPIFGREEDAADQLAAYIILLLDKTVASHLIRGTAYAFQTESKERKSKSTIEHASEHGTAEQRYYNVLCLAFGAHPKHFSDLKSKRILPKDRAERCQDEFEQIEDAYRAVILPHVDQPLAKEIWGKLEVRTK